MNLISEKFEKKYKLEKKSNNKSSNTNSSQLILQENVSDAITKIEKLKVSSNADGEKSLRIIDYVLNSEENKNCDTNKINNFDINYMNNNNIQRAAAYENPFSNIITYLVENNYY